MDYYRYSWTVEFLHTFRRILHLFEPLCTCSHPHNIDFVTNERIRPPKSHVAPNARSRMASFCRAPLQNYLHVAASASEKIWSILGEFSVKTPEKLPKIHEFAPLRLAKSWDFELEGGGDEH